MNPSALNVMFLEGRDTINTYLTALA